MTRTQAGPEICPLTPDRLGDFVSFFDGDAFADNPEWASCYCLFYEFSGGFEEWERRKGAENRSDKFDRIRRGDSRGYLAYVDGRPAGWCNAAPRAMLPGLDRNEELRTWEDVSGVGSIVCFVIAPAYRKQGLATRLLEAACAGLRDQGCTVAEAYPAPDPKSDAQAYHGPLAMYEAAGFVRRREAAHYVVVRKPL